MTNIIKNRIAAPAAFGSVLDQLFPKNVNNLLVNNLLDDAFWGFGSAVPPVAPVNIRETAEHYELELSAPGLQKSDFQLKIEGDTLTISYDQQAGQQSGTTDAESNPRQIQDNTQPRWVRREFTQQPFQRHFELGNAIDREKIHARYDNGILHLTLPKKESLRPVARQIDIS